MRASATSDPRLRPGPSWTGTPASMSGRSPPGPDPPFTPPRRSTQKRRPEAPLSTINPLLFQDDHAVGSQGAIGLGNHGDPHLGDAGGEVRSPIRRIIQS